MLRPWFCCGTVAATVVALALLGCGDGGPAFDPSARYSPESLAGELVFRYRSLHPDRRDVPKPRPVRTRPEAASKSARAATKEDQATTLDELVRETLTKAGSIPDLSRPDAVGRIAEAVAKDASVPEADRKRIIDRLRAEGG